MPYSAEHEAKTRARIVESARVMFNHRGFEQVSIDEIMQGGERTRTSEASVRQEAREPKILAATLQRFSNPRSPKPAVQSGPFSYTRSKS